MRRRARGFTYLGVLLALLLMGFALATAGTVWTVERQRDREAELLWRGAQIRQAIRRYYVAAPVGIHQYPGALEDLLDDTRSGVPVHHLRRLYADPIGGGADWLPIRLADGALIGVSSRSSARPMKRANFAPADAAFRDAEVYSDWRFVYLPQLADPVGTGD
ncbi:MAG: hypothetical protein U1F30_07280 [Steroidobacteraceae bacterium]